MNEQSERTVRPRRSFIFAPGLKPDMYPKALASGAAIAAANTRAADVLERAAA